MKNPYNVLHEFVKDKLERDRKTFEFIHTQTDSLITWLIGFSFTTLLLISSNIASIRTNLKSTAKPIIFFFFITVIVGLAFRYISYIMMLKQKSLDGYFDAIFKKWNMTPIAVDGDIESSSFPYIMQRLK